MDSRQLALAGAILARGLSSRPTSNRVSEREYEVLLRLGRGDPIKGIAEDLQLSASTVSTYRRRLMHKLGLQNNAQIVRLVMGIEQQIFESINGAAPRALPPQSSSLGSEGSRADHSPEGV